MGLCGYYIMIKVLQDFLNKNNINLNNQNICIGISTGVDSTVLLDCLLKLKSNINYNIILCHVNHQKREQSKIEEQYIKDFSKKNNLILEILHLDLQEIEDDNFQCAARNKRLEFFNGIMNKYNCKYLFLAHHLNDDIETSLMHIIRGSNLQGYAGMREIVYNNDEKIILRPFLTILKDEIIKYASDNNIKYFEDDSNLSDCYTRNRVRHHLIPLLFKENPNFSNKYIEFKETLLNSYDIVCNNRDKFIADNVIINNSIIEFNIIEFNKLTEFMKTEIIFKLLKQYNLSKKNVSEIIKYISSNKANLIIDYKNITFSKQYDRVVFKKIDKTKKIDKINNKKVNIIIDNVGNYDINDKYYLEVKEYFEEDYKNDQINLTNLNVIWYNSSNFPFVLRNRINGDKIKINNGTKKVKDLLIDEKIPVEDRDNLLMISKDDEIINIFGVKKSSTLLNTKNNNILISLREKK